FVLVHLLTHEGILLKKLLIRGRLHNWIYRLKSTAATVPVQHVCLLLKIDKTLKLSAFQPDSSLAKQELVLNFSLSFKRYHSSIEKITDMNHGF
ncbi:hypothetical protein, partial [Aeromonas popoffii]